MRLSRPCGGGKTQLPVCPVPSLQCAPMPPTHPGVTTWGLVLIGDNATDKVGLCGPQVGHQLVEVLLGVRRGEKAQEGREAELETAVDEPHKDCAVGA